jgi:hypothetical protein
LNVYIRSLTLRPFVASAAGIQRIPVAHPSESVGNVAAIETLITGRCGVSPHRCKPELRCGGEGGGAVRQRRAPSRA